MPARGVTRQTLVDFAFRETQPEVETEIAYTWGNEERVTHMTCVDCTIQETRNHDERV